MTTSPEMLLSPEGEWGKQGGGTEQAHGKLLARWTNFCRRILMIEVICPAIGCVSFIEQVKLSTSRLDPGGLYMKSLSPETPYPRILGPTGHS